MIKGVLILRNIDQSWYVRPEKIRVRKAAGGIIARKEEGLIYVALITESRFPDEYALPKGGIEKGENEEKAARREIHEEAGITYLKRISYLGKQERLSFSKKSWAVVHYFLFTTTQKYGIPTDKTKKHFLNWFEIDKIPNLFWPEQQELIQINRQRILEAFNE